MAREPVIYIREGRSRGAGTGPFTSEGISAAAIILLCAGFLVAMVFLVHWQHEQRPVESVRSYAEMVWTLCAGHESMACKRWRWNEGNRLNDVTKKGYPFRCDILIGTGPEKDPTLRLLAYEDSSSLRRNEPFVAVECKKTCRLVAHEWEEWNVGPLSSAELAQVDPPKASD